MFNVAEEENIEFMERTRSNGLDWELEETFRKEAKGNLFCTVKKTIMIDPCRVTTLKRLYESSIYLSAIKLKDFFYLFYNIIKFHKYRLHFIFVFASAILLTF